MPKIYLVDATNRDGVQASRISLSKLQKTIINLMLDEMGVFESEFGFPTAAHETNYLNANLGLSRTKVIKHLRLAGWVRAIKSDIEVALKHVPQIKNINMSISTSAQMIKHKFKGKLTPAAIIAQACDAVCFAKNGGVDEVALGAEDASRTGIEYLAEFFQAAKSAGADRLRYSDTLGFDTPFSIYDRICKIAQATKMPIEIHCHNDLGMAVGNSIAGARAAVDCGVDAYINTCVNGVGERAGNADLVNTILAIKYGSGMERYNLDEKVILKKAWRLAKYTAYAFGLPIPINQPGVGANAFAHESGIHADGALKNRRNYELYDHEELGRGEPEIIDTGRQITVGEYSGIKGFRDVYEKMAIAFHDDKEARRVLELVRFANVHNQKPLVEDELKFVAAYPDICKQILTLL